MRSKTQRWRCKYSEEGKRVLSPQRSDCVGIAWKHFFNSDMIRVLWDGQRNPQTIHRRFIEPSQS